MEAPPIPGPPPTMRVAYLLSRYPAVSHTFFLHEVLGLRARGMHIETASINLHDRAIEELPDLEAIEAKATLYIKSGNTGKMFRDVMSAIMRYPSAFARGLLALLNVKKLTFSQRAYWLFYLAEAMVVGRWMEERELNHLHVHFGGPVASVGMLAAAAWQVPYSLTIHGPEELLSVDAHHLREKVERASFVFYISDFCRSQLYQLTEPTEWGKFHVIRLGVDPVTLNPKSRSFSVSSMYSPPRTLELVCIGRLVPAKGHRTLLEAVRQLRDRGVYLRVTLIGSGTELTRLQNFVTAYGLDHAVTFTSALSHAQTLALLRKADIFALASFAEGIPVALMEAMSLGLPCVSTSVAGIPELIRAGIDGLLVPPANPQALADALESLVLDADLRKSLGTSARQRVISQYNLPLNQELLAQTFETKLRQLSIQYNRRRQR
jgi:colanic acid/amylovoran biosynthesis glycosyltransferase